MLLYPIELWDCFGDAIASFALLLQSYVVTDSGSKFVPKTVALWCNLTQHRLSLTLSPNIANINSPFASCLKPLFQSEANCNDIDMKMSFYSHENKTHFHQKCFALQPYFESEGCWNSEMAYSRA